MSQESPLWTDPPKMPVWNLALRFGLEMGALAGLGTGTVAATNGPFRWAAATAVVIVAAGAWGSFNVSGDPSRSGAAPVEIRGAVRLIVEAVVLGSGAAGLLVAMGPVAGLAFFSLVVFHYVASFRRLDWLLGR